MKQTLQMSLVLFFLFVCLLVSLPSFRYINCGLCSFLPLPFLEAAAAIPSGSVVYKNFCNLSILCPYFCYTWCSDAIGHFKCELILLVVCPQACSAQVIYVTCSNTHVQRGYFHL